MILKLVLVALLGATAAATLYGVEYGVPCDNCVVEGDAS